VGAAKAHGIPVVGDRNGVAPAPVEAPPEVKTKPVKPKKYSMVEAVIAEQTGEPQSYCVRWDWNRRGIVSEQTDYVGHRNPATNLQAWSLQRSHCAEQQRAGCTACPLHRRRYAADHHGASSTRITLAERQATHIREALTEFETADC